MLNYTRLLPLLCVLALVLGGASVAGGQTPPPSLFFSDLDSGPNSGGETVNGFSGAYVTLYGNFFGASQGNSTVTLNGLNCLRVVSAIGNYTGWGSTWLWYQKIIVQLGSSCGVGDGTGFKVTVNGQVSNALRFTIRAGNIHFVATTGNDASNGSFASPWASMQHALDSSAAGDTTYVENGVVEQNSNRWIVGWHALGTSGNPVALVAYPGAVATIKQTNNDFALLCAGPDIGVSFCRNGTVAGLVLLNTGGTFAIDIRDLVNPNPPTNQAVQNWRIIANDISCPSENGQDGCAHFSNGGPWYFYGNYIHDMSTVTHNSSKQSHSAYFTTDANHAWVAWNQWFNNFTCRDLQFHSSPVGSCGTTTPNGWQQYDLHVHDNRFNGNRCNAINFATIDPSLGAVEAYNNVIANTGTGPASTDGDSDAYAGIYSPNIANCTPQSPAGHGPVYVYNNSFYNVGSYTVFGSLGGCIYNSSSAMPIGYHNNLCDVVTSGAGAYVNAHSTTVSGNNDDWYGAGASPSGFTNSLNVDPLFVNVGTLDLQLQSSSPAIGAGVASWTGGSAPAWDIGGRFRPSPPSIGAYEISSGTPPPRPNPPTNLNVVVQ